MNNKNNTIDIIRKSLKVYMKIIIKEFENQNKDYFFDAFKNYFTDRSDFDASLDNLSEETKNKIIRLGYFYYKITKEIGHAGVTLISIFSIMEATSTDKFKTFDQWVLSKIKYGENLSYPIDDRKHLRNIILSFQKEYFKEYGSSEKVRRFINAYFSTEDRQQLTKGFKIKDKSLSIDTFKSDERIKIIVDALYNERNNFVHNGQFPQITDQQGKLFGSLKIKNKYRYVTMEISINTIKKMFERAFIKYIREIRALKQIADE